MRDSVIILFPDCISKVIVTDSAKPELVQAFNDLKLNAQVVYKKEKRAK